MGRSSSRPQNYKSTVEQFQDIHPQTATDDIIKNYLAVVAMDFGTVNSGFAFSFRNDYTKCYTSSSHSKFPKDRVPTSVLLNSEKKLHSFGKEADKDYQQILEEENEIKQCNDLSGGSADGESERCLDDWFYFERFKMALYTKEKLARDMKIKDSRCREMDAMTIISLVIKHLKNMAFESINESKVGIGFHENDILYVLTIPAIWSDSARQFMREAAVKAGINKEHLRLVLEPEAASMYCRAQPSVVTQSDAGHRNIEKIPKGFRYILADIGGGTVDICVHEMVDNGHVKELYRDTGGPNGGIYVDKEFENLIAEIIGKSCLERLKNEIPWEFRKFMLAFQKKKKNIGKETIGGKTLFSLRAPFTEFLGKQHNRALQELIATSRYSETIKFNQRTNKLTINNKQMIEVIKPSANAIAKMIETVKRETANKNLKTLILVGGYSDSKYLRDTIQEKMPDMRILHELDAKLAVMKGAVLMGWKPKNVVSRKARFTYGFRALRPFDITVHPHSMRCKRGGTYYCSGIFEKHIERGQEIQEGPITNSIKTSNKIRGYEDRQREFTTEVFRSSRPDPKFCTEEEDCQLVGKIAMTPPAGGWPDSVTFQTQLIVGETEFTVKVVEEGSGKEHVAIIDFL